MAKSNVQFTKDNEYYTPKEFVAKFGEFDYDPATTVVLDDNNLTETHLSDYELKCINIENALLALKNLRKFDKYKEERIEELEKENNKLKSRINKLLDVKF